MTGLRPASKWPGCWGGEGGVHGASPPGACDAEAGMAMGFFTQFHLWVGSPSPNEKVTGKSRWQQQLTGIVQASLAGNRSS